MVNPRHDESLAGRVAIVTGGSRDIGRAVSESLAAAGARVAINWFNSADQAEATLDAITAGGGDAILVRGDMTVAADVEALVAKTRQTWGDAIHALVHVTGGLIERRTLAEQDEAFFEQVMRLNMTSAFLATKAVAPYMPAGSAMVLMSSIAGRDGGGQGASAYAAAKAAMMGFTRAMAKELAADGIRVNALCPGMIDTRYHDRFTPDDVRRKVAAATPQRREGTAEEVAGATRFLLSAEAGFVNGACLDVNGGLLFS